MEWEKVLTFTMFLLLAFTFVRAGIIAYFSQQSSYIEISKPVTTCYLGPGGINCPPVYGVGGR